MSESVNQKVDEPSTTEKESLVITSKSAISHGLYCSIVSSDLIATSFCDYS